MSTVILITSGKGGTGKTSLTGGVGCALAARGRRVLCIDGDVGLRNLDLTLGMTETALMDFTDVIDGRCELRYAAAEHPTVKGLYLLTAPVLTSAEDISQDGMKKLLADAKEQFDCILIDAPAGIGAGFRLAACGADRAVVVATGDLSSLRDAQRTASLLRKDLKMIHLVVNRVRVKLFGRMNINVDDAMDTTGLPLLGLVPEDDRVPAAANNGALPAYAKRGAMAAFENIAARIDGEYVPLMKIKK